MKPIVLDPEQTELSGDIVGAIICDDLRVNDRRFRKGHQIESDDLPDLCHLDQPVHCVILESTDVHEDDASIQLADALAGDGVVTRPPVQSRVNLVADCKGLARIDASLIHEINRLPDMGVFTLIDRLAVLPGKVLAGVKITPVATTRDTLDQAVSIVADRSAIEVKPFLPRRAHVITTEGMEGKTRARFEQAVQDKVAWYGSEVMGFTDLPNDSEAVAGAISDAIDDGANLIMTGGGNTIDPLDAALLALPDIGGEMVRFGAPAHPGSMFWLGYRGDVPIFNLASCSMYSQATVADLILPWIMAGERVTTEDLDTLGYGGLLDRDMRFRFPPYDQDSPR